MFVIKDKYKLKSEVNNKFGLDKLYEKKETCFLIPISNCNKIIEIKVLHSDIKILKQTLIFVCLSLSEGFLLQPSRNHLNGT